jgi:hypothetical protein
MTRLLVNIGMKRQGGERGCTAHTSEEFYIHFTKAQSDSPNRVNVYDRCKMLPGCSVVSLAATILCPLQLYSVRRLN